MTKKIERPFMPEVGEIYRLHDTEERYICLGHSPELRNCVIMQNINTGWKFEAIDCNEYPDGSIDWGFSVRGRFEKVVEAV